MKFVEWKLICVLFFLPFIFSCENKGVTGVSISEKMLIMEVGDTVRLTATVHPSDASNQKVIWTSNNASVVGVTNNGLLTANSLGKSIVSVITVEGEYTDSCDVEVIEKSSSITKLTLNHSSLSLYEGSEYLLEVDIQPAEEVDTDLIWQSSVEYVATVDNGNITAHKEGETIISVTTMDGSKSAECKVTVKKVGGTGENINEDESIW